jgi:hypothetical protein
MWLNAVLLLGVVLAVIVPGIIAIGSFRWKTGTKKLRAKLEAARLPIMPATYDAREIESLPPPVRRYFHAALTDGQPIISEVRLAHEGQFNMGEVKAKWSRFTSSQMTITRRPGFDWDGRINIAPGMNVFAHDAYVAGKGILHVEALGLVTLADIRGTPEAAQGELMRYLAEAAWYPTALLPSQGVRWEAIDGISARATFADDSTAVSLDFRFDADGLISGVRAAARHRTVNGVLVATPWQGRFWNYETRAGMRIPLDGEVAWELPEGLWPYWRGRTTEVAYEFAQSANSYSVASSRETE